MVCSISAVAGRTPLSACAVRGLLAVPGPYAVAVARIGPTAIIPTQSKKTTGQLIFTLVVIV